MNKLIMIVLTLVLGPAMSFDTEAAGGSAVPLPSAEPPDGLDLAITILDAVDGAYEVGDTLRVTSRVENISDVHCFSYVITFYASTNKVISTSDHVVFVKNRPDLGVGESHYYYNDLEIPASLPDGTYYIGAILTVDGDVNNDNNLEYDLSPVTIGDPPPPFQINPGLNDAWYNPATDGQGFFVTVFPDLGLVSVAWFTYDTELPPDGATANLGDPGHRWFNATGRYEGNQATLKIKMTSGGIFDTSAELAEVTRVEDGTMGLVFDSCNSGTVEYWIPSIGQSGIVEIQRIAGDNIALCEVLEAQD